MHGETRPHSQFGRGDVATRKVSPSADADRGSGGGMSRGPLETDDGSERTGTPRHRSCERPLRSDRQARRNDARRVWPSPGQDVWYSERHVGRPGGFTRLRNIRSRGRRSVLGHGAALRHRLMGGYGPPGRSRPGGPVLLVRQRTVRRAGLRSPIDVAALSGPVSADVP
jgi:hypothetical protein